jgi:hypothetical protein
VKKLIKDHAEIQTNYRITAHQKRGKYHRTTYMGSASPTGQ